MPHGLLEKGKGIDQVGFANGIPAHKEGGVEKLNPLGFEAAESLQGQTADDWFHRLLRFRESITADLLC